LIFAFAMREVAVNARCSRVPAYLIASMALSIVGIAVFAHPHPLHNVFGISELIGYQAPLALALTWRSEPRAKSVVTFSWLLYGLVLVAILLNLSSLARQGVIWQHIADQYGLVQRALFAAWFGWCALVGALLFSARWTGLSAKDLRST
jgi:hypothetical protein